MTKKHGNILQHTIVKVTLRWFWTILMLSMLSSKRFTFQFFWLIIEDISELHWTLEESTGSRDTLLVESDESFLLQQAGDAGKVWQGVKDGVHSFHAFFVYVWFVETWNRFI